jgi:hypothetical protein
MSQIQKIRGKLFIAILLAGCTETAIPANADVINGNFSAGNTGFSTQYTFASPTDPGGGHYIVGSNPHTWNSALSSFGDHTSGTGQMLIADGATSSNVQVWSESIAVAANTQYTFTFWAASCGNDSGNGSDPSPATLVATANGTQVGSTFNAPATNGSWTEFSAVFNSSSSSNIPLTITDSNLVSTGNDFALDDISVAPTPEPGGLVLTLGALGSLLIWRRRCTI